MNIKYSNFPGILKDMEICLYFLYNKNYEKENDMYGVSYNKNVKQSLDSLSKKINFSSYKNYIDIFFNDEAVEDKLSIGIPVERTHMLWNFQDINDFFNYMRSMSSESFINILLTGIDNISRSNSDIHNILNDKTYMLNLVKDMPINSRYKWQLVELICNIKNYKESYINFMEYFYDFYAKEVEHNKRYVDNFSCKLRKIIDAEGIKHIEGITGKKINTSNVSISFSFYGNISISMDTYNDTTYLILGIDSEKTYNRNSNDFSNVYKSLGDTTRFSILKCISENNYLTMQELSNMLKVSVPTIKYHIDLLIFYNLISIEKKKNKTIYEINKETLRNSCNHLVKEFGL